MAPAEQLDAGIVTLRRWSSDWALLLDAAINESKTELRRFMPWATETHSLADTEAYIARSVEQWDTGEAFNYAIFLDDAGDDAGRVVGSCGLMARMGPGVLEIGYWVHTAVAGRGIATAVASALAAEGLLVPGIERVAIRHDVANLASGRVAAKAGFTEVGHMAEGEGGVGQTGPELVWERRA
jgi:ribosomal-protein-serine acetyltransferase